MSSIAATAPVAYDHKHKPFPLSAKAYNHPWTWIKREAGHWGGGLGAVHVGTLAVVAIYYILFETITGVKYDWDHLLTGQFHLWGWRPTHSGVLSTNNWDYYRHMIRGVGEGLLGGVLGQMMLVSYYKKYRKVGWLDKAEIKLGIPNAKHVHEGNRLSTVQMLFVPILILIYAIPGFALGAGVIALLHHASVDLRGSVLGAHASTWQATKTIWTSNIDQKLVGLFASFVFARRITKAAGLSVQAWFAEHRRRNGRKLVFYHWLSPTFMARYNGMPESVYASADAEARHSGAQAAIVSGGLVLLIALAIFGWYVLAVIAKG